MDKKSSRIRRARKTRARIAAKGMHRLCVHRTPRHIYAQIIAPGRDQTLVAASTVEKDLRGQLANGGNVAAAQLIGRTIAERAKGAGIETVAFDRAGFQYHGRIQALAEAAREAGLQF